MLPVQVWFFRFWRVLNGVLFSFLSRFSFTLWFCKLARFPYKSKKMTDWFPLSRVHVVIHSRQTKKEKCSNGTTAGWFRYFSDITVLFTRGSGSTRIPPLFAVVVVLENNTSTLHKLLDINAWLATNEDVSRGSFAFSILVPVRAQY